MILDVFKFFLLLESDLRKIEDEFYVLKSFLSQILLYPLFKLLLIISFLIDAYYESTTLNILILLISN